MILEERFRRRDAHELRATAQELSEVHALGAQIGIVVGGGNIFRGLKGASVGMDRAQGDYMGMLATVINSLAMHERSERGVFALFMSVPRFQNRRTRVVGMN